MSALNTAYTRIVFTRSDNVNMWYITSFKDTSDLDEQFNILKSKTPRTRLENKLFGWIDGRNWTLNEFINFAVNNLMCLQLFDKNNTEISSYGVCAVSNRIFNQQFGLEFN